MPLPLLLAAAAVPTIYKGIAGIIQGNEAANLKKRDTTPASFTEALGVTRQAAAAGLPGEAQQLNRLDAGQNSALAAGERAGTSSSSILGLLASTADSRTRALADLSTRAAANQQQQNSHLTSMLQQQAAYQKADQSEFDRNKAALTESSQRNIFGAVGEASQLAAYGIAKADEANAGKKSTNLAASASALSPYDPDRVGRRYNQYGVPGLDLPLGRY